MRADPQISRLFHIPIAGSVALFVSLAVQKIWYVGYGPLAVGILLLVAAALMMIAYRYAITRPTIYLYAGLIILLGLIAILKMISLEHEGL